MTPLARIRACEFSLDRLNHSQTPFVVEGLVAHWPVVAEAKKGALDVLNYLRQFDVGRQVPVVIAPPECGGRIGYNHDMSQLNSHSHGYALAAFFDQLLDLQGDEHAPLHYVGTAFTEAVLPGFKASNDLAFEHYTPDQFMWIGNRSCIAAHYDVPDNLACNVAGRRKVTLFPPEQIDNLYVGPLDFTPAGQAISLVDIRHPDLTQFPRYALAAAAGFEAELQAGDALFIPSLWWHHVQGLDDVNILVNYWWRQCAPFALSPADAMTFAIASIRDLPEHQKQQWRQLFDHYVFHPSDRVCEHIPEPARGLLGPLKQGLMRQLRAKLLAKLNR